MKQNKTCPKCQGKDLFVIEKAQIPNYEYSNSVVPLTLTAHYGPTERTGFLGGTISERVGVPIEAYVCAACAYTELYAGNLDVLEQFADKGVAGVRRLRS